MSPLIRIATRSILPVKNPQNYRNKFIHNKAKTTFHSLFMNMKRKEKKGEDIHHAYWSLFL
jgi:hypothetical protein